MDGQRARRDPAPSPPVSQPYSERFMLGQSAAAGVVDSFTVPAGKRAIVRCVTYADATATGTGSIGALVLPGSVFAVIGSVAGAQSVERTELHIVLEAGETVSVFKVGGSLFWSVSGYLLDDP